MTDKLSPKEVAAWHRAEATKHQSLADFHQRIAETLEGGKVINRLNGEVLIDNSEVMKRGHENVTLGQLEEELQARGGRVAHLASRLNTTESVIEQLLSDPKCGYVIGPRGFIYNKNDPKLMELTE